MERLIFISHSSKDEKIAAELCEYLERHGKTCFIAPRNIRYGRDYAEEIIDGIDHSQALVLLLSNHSNQSAHVLREVERAVSKSIPIITYKLEDVELSKSMEYFLMTHQWMDAEKNGVFSDVLECINDIEGNNAKNNIINQQETVLDKAQTVRAAEPLKKKPAVPYMIAGVLAIICIVAVVLVFWQKKDSSRDMTAGNSVASHNRDENSTIDTENTINTENTKKEIKVGDIINFGSYNNEIIEWRVLKLSDDKKEAVLISKDILCMKAYDAAESGAYNSDGTNDYWKQVTEADSNMELQAMVRGNSDWRTSNIRTWLNSSDEVVKYEDQKPAVTAMSEKHNGYDLEAGFLNGFTEEEREAILEVENVTRGNELSEDKTVKTTDRVYLLSVEELEWFEEAGISMLAQPTEAAIEQSESKWYDQYVMESRGIEYYCWWLREPVEGYSSKCYLVGNGFLEENIWNRNVGLEGFGIRPAITVDLEKITY